MKIAVIGAGMAGLTAARILQSAGAMVTVFDKSKGTGGRLSSRSFEGGWIDHGAPYFSGELHYFPEFLQEQLPGGTLHLWQPEVAGTLRQDEQLQSIGVPRNSAITRELISDLNFQPSTRIARLAADANGWRLYNDGDSLLGVWQQVIVAVPAPQAMTLLKDQDPLVQQIGAARMEPCWVAAIRTEKQLPIAEVAVYDHPVIRRIVDNSSKPNRNNENVYLVQASKNWSEMHLEDTAETVGRELRQSFIDLAAGKVGCELLFVHRWRYAFTDVPLGQSFLWEDQLKLGVCGDWCLGRRVEDAWKSGADLAVRMLTHAEQEPF